MTFLAFDAARAAHLLARIQSTPDLHADALFERCEIESCSWSSGTDGARAPRLRTLREEGFAVRLRAADRCWIESRDGFAPEAFSDALRRVARSLPTVPLAALELAPGPWPGGAPVLPDLPGRIERRIREMRAAFPVRLQLSLHSRDVLLVGPAIATEPQQERFLAWQAELPDHRLGGLLPLSPGWRETAVEHIAQRTVERFRSGRSEPPDAGRVDVVLGPNATAVLLHEAVAHALEADVLAEVGDLDHCVGRRLGPSGMDVLDDPVAAPAGVARTHDDEGTPTFRRWLLRDGSIQQPLADLGWAERASNLDPGAGRRASRHELPGPRSYCLHLLPGSSSRADLFGQPGLWVDQIDNARFEPSSGLVRLRAGCGRRIGAGGPADRVGGFEIRGRIDDLLGAVEATGTEVADCGAGWCAKGGQRLPVWARTPAIRLGGVEVRSA